MEVKCYLTYMVDKWICGIKFLDRGGDKFLKHKYRHVIVKHKLNIYVITTCIYLLPPVKINCNTQSEAKFNNETAVLLVAVELRHLIK